MLQGSQAAAPASRCSRLKVLPVCVICFYQPSEERLFHAVLLLSSELGISTPSFSNRYAFVLHPQQSHSTHTNTACFDAPKLKLTFFPPQNGHGLNSSISHFPFLSSFSRARTLPSSSRYVPPYRRSYGTKLSSPRIFRITSSRFPLPYAISLSL